jgi:hypothetical protein
MCEVTLRIDPDNMENSIIELILDVLPNFNQRKEALFANLQQNLQEQ